MLFRLTLPGCIQIDRPRVPQFLVSIRNRGSWSGARIQRTMPSQCGWTRRSPPSCSLLSNRHQKLRYSWAVGWGVVRARRLRGSGLVCSEALVARHLARAPALGAFVWARFLIANTTILIVEGHPPSGAVRAQNHIRSWGSRNVAGQSCQSLLTELWHVGAQRDRQRRTGAPTEPPGVSYDYSTRQMDIVGS